MAKQYSFLIYVFIFLLIEESLTIPQNESRTESQGDREDLIFRTRQYSRRSQNRRVSQNSSSKQDILTNEIKPSYLDDHIRILESVKIFEQTSEPKMEVKSQEMKTAKTPKKKLPKQPNPSPNVEDEAHFAEIDWETWAMLFVGLTSLLVGLVLCCCHQNRSFRHRRMSQFPMAFTNPIYDQALRDLRSHDDLEINHGREAMDYFSAGTSTKSPRIDPQDPWKEVSFSTPTAVNPLES